MMKRAMGWGTGAAVPVVPGESVLGGVPGAGAGAGAFALVLPHTNYLYVDIPAFRRSIGPENYGYFVEVVSGLIDGLIRVHGVFEIHINMTEFSVSTFEKNIPLIKHFVELFCGPDSRWGEALRCIHIYYTPFSIKTVMGMLAQFRRGEVRFMTHYHSREESGGLLERLFVDRG